MATWIVRAGSEDEYLNECLASGFVAIGWKEVRGQTLIKDVDFNDIYHKLQVIYSSDSNHTIGAYTSQIHAFANKMYGGDFVLIPSGKGKKISVDRELSLAFLYYLQNLTYIRDERKSHGRLCLRIYDRS